MLCCENSLFEVESVLSVFELFGMITSYKSFDSILKRVFHSLKRRSEDDSDQSSKTVLLKTISSTPKHFSHVIKREFADFSLPLQSNFFLIRYLFVEEKENKSSVTHTYTHIHTHTHIKHNTHIKHIKHTLNTH
jgi:hypothetical protein